MTPAIKQLDKLKADYEVCAYTHAPSAESYGLEAATALNLSPKQVFKTLVVNDNLGELAVGIVPVSGTLNLKKIASSLGVKKVAMADKHRVEVTTGYVLGGVSPLGQKKRLRTVLDESAFSFDVIYVSAGKRGLDIELSPFDLAKICTAKRAEIAHIEK